MNSFLQIRKNFPVQPVGDFFLLDGRQSVTDDLRRLFFMEFNIEELADTINGAERINLRYNVAALDGGGSKDSIIKIYIINKDIAEKYSNNHSYKQAKEAGLITDTSILAWSGEIGEIGEHTTGDILPAIKAYLTSGSYNGNIIIRVEAAQSYTASIHSDKAKDSLKPVLQVEKSEIFDRLAKVKNDLKNNFPTAISDDTELLSSVITQEGTAVIKWVSSEPDYIDGGGVINKKASFGDKDKEIILTAEITILNDYFIKYNQPVLLLANGSFAGRGSNIDGNVGEIAFNITDTATDIAQGSPGYVLELPNGYFDYGRNYEVSISGTPDSVRFIPVPGEQTTIINLPVSRQTGNVIVRIIGDNAAVHINNETAVLRRADERTKELLAAADEIFFINIYAVTDDLELPERIAGVSVCWNTSDAEYISNTGKVSRPFINETDKIVTLTAVFTKDAISYTRKFAVRVLKRTDKGAYKPIKDPNDIPNEKFFGLWNSKEGKWAEEPVLRYDLYPKLNSVLASVKNNDYTQAKERLLAYFKNNRDGQDKIISYETAVNNSFSVPAEMAADQIYSFAQNDAGTGIMYVLPEWNYYSADIGRLQNTYFLLDSDMDGSAAEVMSKEHIQGHSAILEVMADGKTVELPAIADTYVSAGKNKNKNYGNETILQVREQAESLDLPVSDKTARAYFRFDTDSIKGKVTEIRLKIYAHSVSSAKKKLYVCTTVNEKGFDESGLTWNKIYTQMFNMKQTGYRWLYPPTHQNTWGVEYEWVNYCSRMYQAEWLSGRYTATKDDRYAYRIIEFVLSVAEQHPDYSGANPYPRILEEAWRVPNIVEAFFATLPSDILTADELLAQLKYIYGHALRLEDAQHPTSNWYSAILTGFQTISAYFPEMSKDGWWGKGKERILGYLVEAIMNPDGSYLESTTGYIGGVIDEMMRFANFIAKVDGYDDPMVKQVFDTYEKLTKYLFDIVHNSGTTSPWGDGGRADFVSNGTAFRNFSHNPHFEYFATNGNAGTEPNYYSIAYYDKALAVMRSNWLRDGFSMFINNDWGGNHSHNDDLAVDVSAYGKLLLAECGNASYSPGSKMYETRHSTLSHSTLQIDGMQQSAKKADTPDKNYPQPMALSTNRMFDILHANNTVAYTGFEMNRKVFALHDRFWIISDYIENEKVGDDLHEYKQIWHPDIDSNVSIDENTGCDLKTQMAQTHYSSGANIKIIPADPESITARISSIYAMHPTAGEVPKDYVTYTKMVTGDVSFDTVLFPIKENEDVNVGVERLAILPELSKGAVSATALKIKMDTDIGYYYSYNEKLSEKSYRFDCFSTDGRMAYAEYDCITNKIKALALTEGKYLKQEDITLIQFDNALGTVEVGSTPKASTVQTPYTKEASNSFGVIWERDAKSLKLYLSDNAVLSGGVKIFCDYLPEKITLNGRGVKFTYDTQMKCVYTH